MQLEFLWRDEDTLQRLLERETGLRLRLVVTDNSSTMLRVRREPGQPLVHLRLHRMFLAADKDVVKALAQWVQRPKARQPGTVLDQFIAQNRHLIGQSRPRPVPIRSRGVHWDLQRFFREINHTYFGGRVDAAITWGRMPSRRRRRSIRYGSYSQEQHLIRIHPALDQDFVPDYFVRYIVYHEMLHADMGLLETEGERRQIHTRHFYDRERSFKEYGLAVAWHRDEANLRKLLR